MTPVEQAVRADWGRLLALLVAQYRRLDAALAACGNETERAHLAHRRRQMDRGGVPR